MCVCALDIQVNLTPVSQMNTESFARRMTGSESLNDDQKKQIREQQEVVFLAVRLCENVLLIWNLYFVSV